MSIFRRPQRPPAAPALTATAATPAAATPGTSPAPAVYGATRTLTAAAAPVTRVRGSTGTSSTPADWQTQAWYYYDQIGEIKFAFSMVANLVSRIRLYPALIPDPSSVPTPLSTDPRIDSSPGTAGALAAFGRLDGLGGKPQLLRSLSLNFLVAGECYLVQTPATASTSTTAGTAESWDARSVSEVTVDGNGVVTLTDSPDKSRATKRVTLPRTAYIARMWRSHPRYSYEADSSMLGLLDLCSELLLLSSTYRATARSRLNAGALYLPDGLSISSNENPIDPSAVTDDEAADEFETSLIEAMSAPVSDEASVSSLVPIIIRGPEQLGEKIKHIKFERSFDPALTTRADRVLDRIMQGIDVPKDIVQGLANVRYSNAVTIDENLYKAHIEPLALLICDALTAVFLRPVMRALGVSDSEAARYCIWYDPSQITTKPNRSEDADRGLERGVLSGEAWRAAHGFSDLDAPSANELVLNMLTAQGALTPELTEALLAVVAPDMMAHVKKATQANMPAPLDPGIANALGLGTDAAVDTDADAATTPDADADADVTTQPAEDEVEIIDPSRLM